MSTETTETTERTPLQGGVDWVAKHWPRVRLGHEGFMLDKIQRESRIVEQLAKNAMTGKKKDVDVWPGNDGDDAMGVNIGDHIHYHQVLPPEPTPEPVAQAPEPASQSKGMSTTAKVATSLAAAALLGPGGVGMAAMLGAFDKPPVPVVAPVDTDTDTIPTVIIKPHAE